MDFFAAQERARQRTSRLLGMFALAVAGTILAAYVSSLLIMHYAGLGGSQRAVYGDYDPRGAAVGWWQPQLLGWIAAGTLVVVGLASLLKWRQYAAGGSVVAESIGGRRVDPGTRDLKERQLLNVVEEMAIASGTPVPGVYVLDDEPAINAFAAGLTRNDAVVAVTRGTLDKLSRDELQGVVGHEFSHILNGDMRLNLKLAAAIFGILVIGLAGRGILWSLRGSRVRSRNKGGGQVMLVGFAAGFSLMIIGYVGYFFGRLIQAAVSRQREFLADASAVQFTRNPFGLTGALKKIGGYALGSRMESSKSAAIGHFFFAQAFRAGLTGLWATHPPLDVRIRAIEPRFDGKYFEPPEVVDVARDSFVTAGLAPPAPATPPPILKALAPAAAAAGVSAIGTLSPEQIDRARQVLDQIPAVLREAAHDAAAVPVLVYGILLDREPAVRSRQLAIVSERAGAGARQRLDALGPALASLSPDQKFPLLQLALPTLRQLPAASLGSWLETLDELVHADHQVSALEFALQKLLIHSLKLGRSPGDAVVQYHSFQAVLEPVALVLSVLATRATTDVAWAARAFSAGAAQLPLIQASLVFRPDAGLSQLDDALDVLARASLPIKARALAAAAATVTADGRLLVEEGELLRAIAAALDCPMPPLGGP